MKAVAQAVREGCEAVCSSIDELTEAVKGLSSNIDLEVESLDDEYGDNPQSEEDKIEPEN